MLTDVALPSMNVHDDRADDAQNHKKKRACDYCKAKRVICHPQPDAKPCPRCLEKGIQLQRQFIPERLEELAQRLSPIKRDALEIIALSMPSPTPLVPLLSYKDQMTSCGWDFRSHAPQKRILTLCILAAASLVLVRTPRLLQMSELGARRKLLSARLHGEAVRQAHQDGITSFASIENATSCFLLNVLDPNPEQHASVGGRRSVAAAHALRARRHRAVCQLPDVSSRDTSCLQWRGFLSLLAVYAMNAGKSLPFSTYDELLICGPSPASLDQMFSQAEHIPVVQLVCSCKTSTSSALT
ncbi:hypothetical protein BD626DRAFT_574742 [Schizophyllum amplum]|uniref:Zn(2)-C6 fungal-type domain-containing protein n=1 Tax=Schizophyllum amplum TaxID=97359 RepID=A0A550BXM3_9AGAR|nr:hypothetical protein BD626DRAFT_574742 [Auriculariopsis ampla]